VSNGYWAIIVGLVVVATLMHLSLLLVALICALGGVAHIGMNRLSWRLTMQSFGLRWRIRRR